MPEMTEYAPGTPSWIDVGSRNLEATTAFYGALFGWEFAAAPQPDAGGYGMFTLKGKPVAGGGPTMSPDQPPAWTTYITVANADATVKAAQDNGGNVAVPPMDVFDLGRMAGIIDPTGAYIAIWQPGQHKGAQLVNEPGAFVWNELDTRDIEAAKAFYTKVFPWTAKTTSTGDMTYTEWQVNGRSIAGGMQMGPQFPADAPPNWLTYFSVANTDATLAKAQELGATVLVPATDMSEGRFAVVQDPQGAVFAIIQSAS